MSAADRRRPLPDVYLFPAVVGGGLGDIEETLAAGRRLAAAGASVRLYRKPGRPLPRAVDGPWAWPRGVRRSDRLRPTAPAAVTVTPAWGVSAAPERPGPLGRAGPWSEEAAAVEAAYGAGSTVHLSLEEFARTLSPAREERERFREGGIRDRAIAARLRAERAIGGAARFRRAFATFRAFDRPNVLHLFATFRRDPAFAAQFPAAVQTGPLWPGRFRPRRAPPAAGRRREWVWYASPASSERLVPALLCGLAAASPAPTVYVRSPRPWARAPVDAALEVDPRPLPPAAWARRFRAAELRIVTGSRTLLEAIEAGGPFLYFNGILGVGSATHRHRPEKLVAWLAAERGRLSADLARDLRDFARGRRVAEVVARAAGRRGGWRTFPRGPPPSDFRPPFDDAGALAVAVARALGRAPGTAEAIVARVRRGTNP